MSDARHRGALRWLPALLLATALGALALWAHCSGYSAYTVLRWVYDATRDAPWLLLLLFVVRPPFILPESLFVLLCGALWGLWPGGLYAVIGMLLAAASSYALARYVLPPHSSATGDGLIATWAQRLRREGFMAVFVMRLTLLPFDGVNFAAAALRVDFRTFFLATVLGNSIATVIYAGFGTAIRLDQLLGGETQLSLATLIDARRAVLSLALIGLSIVLAAVVRRYFIRPRENRG